MSNYKLNNFICYRKIENAPNYHLYDGIHNQHYIVSAKEIDFWELLKKNLSIIKMEQVTQYNEQDIKGFLATFEEIGLINPKNHKKFFQINTSTIKKGYASLLVEKTAYFLVILEILISLILLGNINIIEKKVELTYAYINDNTSVTSLTVQFLFIIFFSIIFHELGHLIFAINRNIMVPSIHLSLKKRLISVDTTGSQFFKNSKYNLAIYFAGPLFNLILANFFFIGFSITSFAPFTFLCGFILNLLFFMQNMNILFNESDGQKIFIEITNYSFLSNNMSLFFYLKNRKNLSGSPLKLLDFLWFQKILFIALIISYISTRILTNLK